MSKHRTKQVKISVHLFTRFMLWYFRTTGNAGGTAQRAISGINAVLHEMGLGINLHNYNSEPIVRMSKGIDNLRARYNIGRPRVLRRAMINVMVDKLVSYLDRSDKHERVLRATILFEKQTGFRSHNVVMTGHGGFVRVRHLKFHPSLDDPTHLVITLPWAKTKSKYNPEIETRTIPCRCADGPCAVHEVRKLVKKRQAHGYQAVFLLPNGTPVTYALLSNVLKELCKLVGLNPKYYTSHSLRYGQATDLHLKKWSVTRIMKWMGWQSRKSAMRYIRPDNEDFVRFGFSP